MKIKVTTNNTVIDPIALIHDAIKEEYCDISDEPHILRFRSLHELKQFEALGELRDAEENWGIAGLLYDAPLIIIHKEDTP